MTDRQTTSKPPARQGRRKAERLSKQDWLEAGLRLLGQMGPGGIRIDQICKALKVTKGSFYWHFRDRQELMERLVEHWHRRETTDLIAYVETHFDTPADRIWYVVEFVTLGSYQVSIEVAMRQWGKTDDKVRAWLEQVDSERIGFFTRQFQGCGFDAATARVRALSIYSTTLICEYMYTGESRDDLRARMRASLDILLA